MKTLNAAVIALVLWSPPSLTLAEPKSDDPCGAKNSNMEMRECYTREQKRINLETEALAAKIAAEFRSDAKDPVAAGVVADSLLKAATALEQSQRTWRAYRDQHCNAVAYSWTTGSGAGTAHEACMFELDQTRLRQLRTDFNKESK